jgi:hypothetical protein
MKKTITLIALLAGAAGVHAQGTVQFADYVANFTIDVWSPNPAAPTVEQRGNTATDSPVGSTVYGGAPLGGSAAGTGATSYGNGNNYSIGLYASTSSASVVTLANGELAGTAPFQTSGGTGKANVIESPAFGGGGNAGSWVNNTGLALPGTATGSAGSAQIELAAWYNGGGTITSYAAAVAAGDPTGFSQIATITGLGGANPTGPSSTAPTLAGLGITSFSLTTSAVPEPSTIALGIIGASAFLMRLRRKQ